jgi:vesicle coat complex subunit
MIWIIGHYADRIDNAGDLLSGFLETFKEELPVVQLNLLTAIVKLFIRRPAVGQILVPKVLQYATDDVDNPDLRDRGFMYWRLLSTNPVAAKVMVFLVTNILGAHTANQKSIVFSERPPILSDTENLDPALLNELLLNVATLASVYLKAPGMIVGGLKPRLLVKSGAFVDRLAAKQKSENNECVFL